MNSLVKTCRRNVYRFLLNYCTYPVSYHGEYHYRSGSTKQQLRGSALTELIEDKNMYISNAYVFPSDWTTENLMRTHNSRPYNPDLTGIFYRAGYIEAWGRGIQKICEACEELGAPMPEYILLGDDLTVKFSALECAVISDSKTQKRQNGGLADRIILVIVSNKAVTIAEISDILNIPKRTVEREIKKSS